jgi:hypothetical protein
MSNNQAAWEEPFAQEFAHNLVINNLTMRNESDFDKVQSILIRIGMKYSQHYYPAAITLNPRVIALIDHYVKEYKENAPFKTTAIPPGSDVFQGEAVQANLIGKNDDGNIYGEYKPGKDSLLNNLKRYMGITKKPTATPVGGKTRRKRRSKRKTRRHRKKRA